MESSGNGTIFLGSFLGAQRRGTPSPLFFAKVFKTKDMTLKYL